jgi:alkaline phosphatase
MRISNLLFCLVTLLSFTACKTTKRGLVSSENKTPKNIILLIGDGMGLTQASIPFYYQETPSSFTRFRHIGLHQNTPTSHRVTDSAAGATSFASGIKTYNGAIGVDKDTMPVPTILEMLAAQGKSTGLVATSSIQHATPAAFYAHTASRRSYEEIARQLVYSPVNFFIGGGLKFFNQRSDQINYLDSLTHYGFHVDTSRLTTSSLDINKKYGFLLAPDGMPKMQEGRGDFLPKASKMAMDFLSKDDDGFFLMIEGSQIDWGGHSNDADYVIQETLDFDATLGEVLDFAEKDGNTLVVVTADHETGGLSLSAATIFGQGDYAKITPTFSTGNHSATLIPVFAYGPGADQFIGIYQNSDIFFHMLQTLKIKTEK